MTSEEKDEEEEEAKANQWSRFTLFEGGEVDHVPAPLAFSGGDGNGVVGDETVVPPRAVRPDRDRWGARDVALQSVGPAGRAAVDPR